MDPALAAAALAEGDSPLTERERDVLADAAGHDAIAEIAARLHLSPGTVRNHLSAAMHKLGARNRAEAAEIARSKGWLWPGCLRRAEPAAGASVPPRLGDGTGPLI